MIKSLIHTARKVKEAGLVVNSSGNISVKLTSDSFAISASGTLLGELKKSDITLCYLTDPDRFKGKKPSLETELHRRIYLKRADVGAIVHFQSLYATTLACHPAFDFNLNFIPEIPAYIQAIGVVSYHHPGTQALADAVVEAIEDIDCHILVLRNHGQVAVGKTLSEALRCAEFFEFACRIFCQGFPLNRYDPETLTALRNYRPKSYQ